MRVFCGRRLGGPAGVCVGRRVDVSRPHGNGSNMTSYKQYKPIIIYFYKVTLDLTANDMIFIFPRIHKLSQ